MTKPNEETTNTEEKLSTRTWVILILIFILVIGFPIYVHYKNKNEITVLNKPHIVKITNAHNSIASNSVTQKKN